MSSSPTPLAGIVLAAGKGTRMKSEGPKCALRVLGTPLGGIVGQAMREAGADPVVAVVGFAGDAMREALGEGYRYAVQKEQLGTGHAAMMAEQALRDFDGPVLLSAGDLPLITGDALRRLHEEHLRQRNVLTVATVEFADPTGYGRIVRDDQGRPMKIVEEKDANAEIKRIREVCVSVYCFDAKTAFRLLPLLSDQNAAREYYLTDLLEAVYRDGGRADTVLFEDADVFTGVNDRWALAEATQRLRRRILRYWAAEGVGITDPDATYVGPEVWIGKDTVLQPGTMLEGRTVIGEGCLIGPHTRIVDSVVGDGTSILMSHLSEVVIGNGVWVGPYAHLRPGTQLADGVKIGNFVEVKKSDLGEKASVSHLTYIGDATIGKRVNIGAGTITCNYDGFSKHRTVIEEGAFVGSNSTLVAPVTIGRDAIVAAGSTITNDVEADALALGRSRQEVKSTWASRWRERKQGEKEKPKSNPGP